MHVDHCGLQPLHHFRRVLAALAAIDDGDVGGRILPAQLRREPVGIGEFRRGRAVAGGRRRSERDDHDRLAGGELARDMRQRAHRFGAALRRQARHAAEDVAGRFRDLLHLVDRLAGDALLSRPDWPAAAGAACGMALAAEGFCSVLLLQSWRCRTAPPAGRSVAGPSAQAADDTEAGISSARLRGKDGRQCRQTKRVVTTH